MSDHCSEPLPIGFKVLPESVLREKAKALLSSEEPKIKATCSSCHYSFIGQCPGHKTVDKQGHEFLSRKRKCDGFHFVSKAMLRKLVEETF